jgi:hypothetical protein
MESICLKKKVPKSIEKFRIKKGPLASHPGYGFNGFFLIPYRGTILKVLVSDGGGWDHVSVSTETRIPTFTELSFIKDLFWEEQETVIHYFPKKSEYVNYHPYVLHLWKKQGHEHKLPPSIFVGPS